LSAILAGGVGAFIGFLLAQGFTDIKQVFAAGSTIITGKQKDGKPFRVAIANQVLANPQYDIVELDTGTTLLKKSDKPQFEIKNTATGDKRIYTIGIVPDALFKTDGIVEIFLNEVRLFPISIPKQGMLKNVSSLNIPIPANFGLGIKESFSLDVFIYNPNGASATINFSVFIANVR